MQTKIEQRLAEYEEMKGKDWDVIQAQLIHLEDRRIEETEVLHTCIEVREVLSRSAYQGQALMDDVRLH